LALAAEAAQLGFWIRDLATDLIWATEKWRSLFGFSDTEAVNFSLLMQRLHPNDRDDLSKAIRRALEESGSYEREYRVILPDNQMRWISSHGQVELDDRGTPARMLGVSRDVTQRREAELEVLQQRQELTHLSRLTMLGELSGSIAHELNQPLGAILRNTEAAELFLQDPSPDLEEIRAILVDISNDDRRAGAVIDRMRSMLNRRVVEPSPLDLVELVSEVISLVQRDADFRKVTLALRADSSLPPVRGDRVQLQQVLLNLLLNAMDAVSGSALDRRLVNVSVQLEGKSIEVAVSDTGQGIPADKLASIFEQFFTTKPNGMGLGLPISRRIVEAHGGTIHGKNDQDGGATFYFTLPVANGASAS
jgi:PAS domain S-box-containing protein